MARPVTGPALVGLLCACPLQASAAAAPHNVMVLASGARPDSLALLDYYADARGIPLDNRCVIDAAPDPDADPPARVIDADTYAQRILEPVLACIERSPWRYEIDFLVVLRGLPYHVEGPGWSASLESLLALGGTTLAGEPFWSVLPPGGNTPSFISPRYRANALYAVEERLRAGQFPPPARWSEPLGDQVARVVGQEVGPVGPVAWDLRTAFRLDGGSEARSRDLVDRSLASDGTAPRGLWLCMEGADPARGVRDQECIRALELLQALGFETEAHPWDPALSLEEPVIAYFTGAANLQGAIDGLTYLPGAIADNITSFGAVPENWYFESDGGESQTSIVRFLAAGATATHGTSAEPFNTTFPSAGLLLLYASGYSLGDAYGLTMPFLRWMNVPVGDPLAAPYATRPEVTIDGAAVLLPDDQITATVTVPMGWRLVALQLFVDGLELRSSRRESLSVEGHRLLVDPGPHVLRAVATVNPEAESVGPPFTTQLLIPRPEVSGWARADFEYREQPLEDPGADVGLQDVPHLQGDGGDAGEEVGVDDLGRFVDGNPGDGGPEAGVDATSPGVDAGLGGADATADQGGGGLEAGGCSCEVRRSPPVGLPHRLSHLLWRR